MSDRIWQQFDNKIWENDESLWSMTNFRWKGTELIEEQIRSAEGVTEELKRQNPMEWVRHCNNIRNRATEIIKQELIYV